MEVLVTKKGINNSTVAVHGVNVCSKIKSDADELFTVSVNVTLLNRSVMKKIDNVKIVAIGYSHVIVLNKDNQVYGIGNNYKGQLGLGEQVNFPEWIYLGKNGIDVAAGYMHSAIVDVDNTVLVTGQNTKQQLHLLANTKEVKVWTALPDVKATSVKTEAFKTEIVECVA